MPMPIIPKALFPIVPFAAGVPALLRSGASILDSITLDAFGLSDALDNVLGIEKNQWGIFDQDGQPIVEPDSVVTFEYSNSSQISNYPIEGGAFSSYNKVQDPFDVMVRMTLGGTEETRRKFVDAVSEASRSLDLYTVITPENFYENANISAISYRRTNTEGANKITIDIRVTEVRQVEAAAFSNPKSDLSSISISLGQIQTVDDVNFDTSGIA